MSQEQREIVVTLNFKKLIALTILVIVSFGTVYSYLVALMAFVAPSQELPLRFNSVGTFNTSDVSSPSFAKGEAVKIKLGYEMATDYYYAVPSEYYYSFSGSETYRLIYTVLDSSNTPVHFESVSGSISVGGILSGSSTFSIPSNANSGLYSVQVYLWGDWLPAGGALSLAGSASFTVT